MQLKRVEYGKGIDDFQKDVKQQEQDNHMTVNESFIYLEDTVEKLLPLTKINWYFSFTN